MCFESSVISVSWIPSDSLSGLYKAGFTVGTSHPGDPLPDVTQTTGGRTGAPMPRPVCGQPYMQWLASTEWTTLTLGIGANGFARRDLIGPSAFPRHWIYDHRGQLMAKAGVASRGSQ
jgi:hypothetical protein